MLDYLEIDDRMSSQEKRQQYYREKYKQLNPAWDDSIMLLERLFREHAKPNMVVLDAGCGRSNFVLKKNKGSIKKIVGIDVSKEATEGNEIVDELLIGDLEHLPFDSNQFDAVISLWVLEHVRDPDRVFSQIARVLKPGGRFYVVTPYAYSYILIAKRIVGVNVTKQILNRFFGRTEEDTFDTCYVANTK